MNIISKFKAAMDQNGLVTDEQIISDGQLRRVHLSGDSAGSANGWYVLHTNSMPAGAYGCWKRGISKTWCAISRKTMTLVERIEYYRRMQCIQYQRSVVVAQSQQYAAKRACQIWESAKSANLRHPYLLKKKIFKFMTRQLGDSLIVPIVDFGGEIKSLQFIDAMGSKKLLSGGAKKGYFIPINKPANHNHLLICEGFATGATLAEAKPDAWVIAAVDAGNLEPVAMSARAYLPHLDIIICGDDDRLNPCNPGRNKARKAAISAGALVAFPSWPVNAPDSLSDFNDLACWQKNNMEVVV